MKPYRYVILMSLIALSLTSAGLGQKRFGSVLSLLQPANSAAVAEISLKAARLPNPLCYPGQYSVEFDVISDAKIDISAALLVVNDTTGQRSTYERDAITL